MINFILNLFRCKHKTKETIKWLSGCNTPMIKITCLDCGEELDYGHVYTDPDTWLDLSKIKTIKIKG